MCAWHSQQMYGALYSTWWSEECMTWLCLCHVLNHIWLSATPRTVAHQALSMGLSQARILERIAISSSRESFWIIPTSIVSPVLQADSLPSEPPRKPAWLDYRHFKLFFQTNKFSNVERDFFQFSVFVLLELSVYLAVLPTKVHPSELCKAILLAHK